MGIKDSISFEAYLSLKSLSGLNLAEIAKNINMVKIEENKLIIGNELYISFAINLDYVSKLPREDKTAIKETLRNLLSSVNKENKKTQLIPNPESILEKISKL